METEVRSEPVIQTLGLSGFKAPAHTHCVLSPLPLCTQGGQRPLVGLGPPGCKHTTLRPGAERNYRLPNTFLRLLQNRDDCKEKMK